MPFRRSRRLTTALAASALATSALVGAVEAPASASAPAPIGRVGFSMHFLGLGSRAYPALPFGSARTQDMGVSWADLQPSAGAWSATAVNRLTTIVRTFHSHGVRPLIVLGMTPDWAKADPSCSPAFPHTCPPQTGAWSAYVRALASTYSGVDFEVWNEPNLHSAFADNTTNGARIMANLQRLAYNAVHAARNGDRVVSPGVAVTPGNEFSWLRAFFRSTGGKQFDYFGIHLYPVDGAVRSGTGPEWSVNMLGQIKTLLGQFRLAGRPIWDTEMNIGRQPAASPTSRQFDESMLGAGMVARTFLLQLSRGVKRVYWYAADDRNWGGTWLEKSDFRHLTYGGLAEKALAALLINARPYGCTIASGGRWTCKFHLASGKNLLAKWTTGRAYYAKAPKYSARLYHPTGGYARIHGGSWVKITAVPQYIWGTFKL